ncbi:30S ribosomal protein S12 methylthiotransferase RimO [bacterium]|nr:30S ribosomal protein S12 methylthiotransferase RimO [bacterium]
MKVAFISLGCPKNRVDTESLLSLLAKEGFILTGEEEAEAVVINTCSFIRPAVRESLKEIRNAKKKGKLVAVVGCLPQRWRDKLASIDADVVLGLGKGWLLPQALRQAKEGKRTNDVGEPDPLNTPSRILLTTYPYAYLKIADGCDNRCHYCTIPFIRGRYRSREEEEILREAEEIAEKGIKELILVAQETTRYGLDLYGELTLPRLLVKLLKIDVKWIRIMYMHPARVTPILLETMANSDKIVKYFDIPFQHASPRILGLMGRGGSIDEYLTLIERIREAIPSACFRSSFIVGFPTESEEDFQFLLSFLEQAKLDKVGFFPYYSEKGTPASRLPELPPSVVKERLKRAMSLQEEIAREKNREFIDKEMEILVERFDGKRFRGRSYREAPEVDGEVILRSKTCRIGDFVTVKIINADSYKLFAEEVEI